ncbi:MAG: tetratricopeptide repeat protein [Taibaiella sp.]|nr:tetratricopeptide repeat protein [Taibaiella sp.]
MKKLLLTLVALFAVMTGYAQKKNIQSASNSLRNKEYQEAVDFIEQAIKDPTTKDDPKAWLLRAQIYSAMEQDPGYTGKGYDKQALESYMKVAQLKSNYEMEQVNQGLVFSAFKSYNTAVNAYNQKQWEDAFNNARLATEIYSLEGGKRFAGNKNFDTVVAAAMVIEAYSAFYNEKLEQAIPALEKLKNNPIEGNANIYLILTDAYRKLGNQEKELATIEEAKKRFPNNPSVRNEELNYYIRTKQQDKLMQKLEAAVAAEPDNAIYQYNLANAYTNMAFPKDASGKSMPDPANYNELIAKAEAGFTKAIAADPDNIGYHYDMGVLYFNQAAKVTEQMNAVTGSSAEDDKKWKELEAKRNTLFDKAMPHLEKVYVTYEPKVNELDADNKGIYQSSLAAMSEIYARQNKLDKAAEIKKKIEASKQ